VADRVAGIESVDLAPLMKTGIRFFSFAARAGDEGTVADLRLPDGARALAVTREGEAEMAEDETRIREHDTVYVVCFQGQVKELRERFVGD
jgi:Trk K+ transport system NAD-binding subunit